MYGIPSIASLIPEGTWGETIVLTMAEIVDYCYAFELCILIGAEEVSFLKQEISFSQNFEKISWV